MFDYRPRYLIFFATVVLIFHLITFIPSYANTNSDIFELSLEELLDISITTAGKKPEKISDVPASVMIITRADIRKNGYMTLAEVIENIPSVYTIVTRSWEGQPFGVRGFLSGEPKNLIVLVNGVNQIEGINNFYQIDAFPVPVESIDRIELIRGPMSVLYGPGAFLGVINIITNETQEDFYQVSATGGTKNTHRLGFHFHKSDNDLKVSINGGYYRTDGPNEPLRTMMINPSTLPFYGINDINSATKKQLEKNYRYLDVSIKSKGFFSNMNFGNSRKEIFGIMPSISNGGDQDITVSKIQFGYTKTFNQYALTGKITNHKKWTRLDLDWINPVYSGYQALYSDGYEAEVLLNGHLKDSFFGTFGLYRQTWTTGYSIYTVPIFGLYATEYGLDEDSSLDQYAAFSQLEYRPHPKISLIAGGRLDKILKYNAYSIVNAGFDSLVVPPDTLQETYIDLRYDRDKIEFIPRFALIYRINPNSILKLLYGKAINRPSLFQFINTTKMLDPEYIETFEINYLSTFSNYMSTNVSLFRNTLENLIVRRFFVNNSGDVVQDYSNSGKIVTNGIETTVYLDPLDYLSLEGSITWQLADDKRPGFENRDVEYSPEFIWHLKGNYSFLDYYTFSLTGRFIDEMETHWDVSIQNGDGTFGNRIGLKSDPCFILDANLHISKLFWDTVDGNIHVNNVLNDRTLYPIYVDNTWADKGMIRDGRSIYITLGKQF